jgi:hypothetical protein
MGGFGVPTTLDSDDVKCRSDQTDQETAREAARIFTRDA